VTDKGDSIRMELRRGVLVLAVLAALREEQYGYSLRKELADAGLAIEEGTLYPLIRRLESQGLLTSRWSSDGGRRKRYYTISRAGIDLLATLQEEWALLQSTLNELLETES